MVDFYVMEAVHMKALVEEADARAAAEKAQRTKEFKSDFSELEQYR